MGSGGRKLIVIALGCEGFASLVNRDARVGLGLIPGYVLVSETG
jgi:hypothetical protein